MKKLQDRDDYVFPDQFEGYVGDPFWRHVGVIIVLLIIVFALFVAYLDPEIDFSEYAFRNGTVLVGVLVTLKTFFYIYKHQPVLAFFALIVLTFLTFIMFVFGVR